MTAEVAKVRHLLIFEPDPRGHAAEWIEHLMRTIERAGYPFEVSLMIPIQLADEIVGDHDEPWQTRVRIAPLRSWELTLCNNRLLSVSSLARWWLVRRRLQRTGADHGLFLSIDLLTLPLGMGLGFGGRGVSGILFRPSVHYAADPDAPRPTVRERIRDLRKAILYRLALRNPSLRAMHSLDPHFPAYAAQHLPHPWKVRSVPDPVHPVTIEGTATRSDFGDIPADRTVLTIFGVLSERKGILVLLEALRRLEARYASRIALYAMGQIERSLTKRLTTALEELADFRPELWWRVDDRRLSATEIATLISRTDVVLAPYQRFVGSSGVLLWAAKAAKPVITQQYGLVGRLTREYGLGVAVDTSDPSALAAAIAAVVRHGAPTVADSEGIDRFLRSRTPDAFARIVLEGISDSGPASAAALDDAVGKITTTD